jgi:MoxR-like ATPase
VYKDGTGRSTVDILFSRKREVDGYPWLKGTDVIGTPAKRNKGTGRLSAMLAKSVVVMLKGDVIGISTLAEGGVFVRSVSQSGGPNHQCWWLDNGPGAYLPRGNVTYHLGLIVMAEALQRKEDARDLLDAWENLLAAHESNGGAVDGTVSDQVATVSDELYYWLRYGPAEAFQENDRLEHLYVLDSVEPMAATPVAAIDHRVLTDRKKLKRYRKGEQEPEVPKVGVPCGAPTPVFKGWQLGELINSVDASQNCLLIGHTGTGKSLCVFEAHERLTRPRRLFVIEGHSSLKEFDLLGGYVPDGSGGFAWRDGVITQALREEGSMLFIDEANRMPARVLNILLGILSRRAVVLTEHGSEEVGASDDFCVVMASNLGRGYHVESFDAALVSRFPVVLEYHYLPAKDEEQLLKDRTGVPKDVARIMVKVANETRRLRRSHELPGCIDARGLIAWATKFQGKESEGEDVVARLKASARITVLYTACGTNSEGYIREDAANVVLNLIEAHTPK